MHFITAKTILSAQNGMNLYRGCQHGCVYCDARSRCYHMDHDFEDVAVKENAIALLDEALRKKRKPCMVGMGAMSDPYLPLEDELLYTRRALDTALRHGCGVTLLTKSARVLRDLDLLRKLSQETRCVVQMTLTTFDEALCRLLEPNVSTTLERFEALCRLRDAGVPTAVWLCPVLPFLTDTEENIGGILDYCARAGVRGVISFGMGLTLRDGNREYFYRALDRHFPGLRERYVRAYGDAYELPSPNAASLDAFFHRRSEKLGLWHNNDKIFRWLREFPEPVEKEQLSLF